MIQNIRGRRGITTDFAVDRKVLNTRNRMVTRLGSLLSISCDLAILSDFFVLRQKRQELARNRADSPWRSARCHLCRLHRPIKSLAGHQGPRGSGMSKAGYGPGSHARVWRQADLPRSRGADTSYANRQLIVRAGVGAFGCI